MNGQPSSLKKAQMEDYKKWERLGSMRLSDDGNWLAYGISRNDKETQLHIRNLLSQKEDTIAHASSATFASNGKYVAYTLGVSTAERESLEDQGESAPRTLVIRNLSTDSLFTIEEVSSFSFSKSGNFMVIQLRDENNHASLGSELLIRDLAKESQTSIGNVSEFAWSDQGELLAFLKDTPNKNGNGIQLYNASTGNLRTLHNERETYTGLYWRKESKDLATYISQDHERYENNSYDILVWKNLDSDLEASKRFDSFSVQRFPEDKRILSRNLTWSKDGNSLFFRIKEWISKPEEKDSTASADTMKKDKGEAPALQIWHSKDVDIIPNQELARSPREAYLSVWHLDDHSFVQLEDILIDEIRLQYDAPILVGYDKTPYDFEAMFGRPNKDLYAVDIRTGKRRKFLTRTNHVYGTSPDGKKMVYLKNDHLHVYDFISQKHTNITQDLPVSFVDLDNDHPVEQSHIYQYRLIGWNMDSKSFYAHSKYDIWELQADGSGGKALTHGKKNKVSHTFVRVDYEADYIDPTQPFYIQQYGEWTKSTGYISLIPGKKATQLAKGDAMFSRFTKAKKGTAHIFTRQTFEDSPNIFYSKEGNGKSEQISNTNSFQQEYQWGKSELITYENAQGKKLQGALFYPANYKKGKKYPMITYIYEKLSQNLHRYTIPWAGSYYNRTIFTHEGYFVLMPDIVFEAGNPGISSAKTIEIAVNKALETGSIDKDRIGLVGHSWGGYQAAFVPTQTDIFAAAVSGAGLMNLISMYGTVTRAFGGNLESDHFETSQERMEVHPWQDLDRYLRNSPILQIENLKTPMLVEIGDNDQNVSWTQGIEFYNAARRLKKQCVLLVYAHEGHSLRQDKNRQDYQRRILAWFGHYLKGEEAEPWILKGISLEEQKRQLENWDK